MSGGGIFAHNLACRQHLWQVLHVSGISGASYPLSRRGAPVASESRLRRDENERRCCPCPGYVACSAQEPQPVLPEDTPLQVFPQVQRLEERQRLALV